MNASYSVRLLCVSLAAFFLVHAVAGWLATALAPAVIRGSSRRGADGSARMLFALRVLPLMAALVVVAGLCVPSYLLFEPEMASEPVGWWCVVAAVAAVASAVRPLQRAVRAVARPSGLPAACRRSGGDPSSASEPAPVSVLESSRPLLALTGLVWPRIVISRGVLDALTPDQISVALGHERAHHDSRDNLKRLFWLAAPDLIPLAGGFERLEREWSRLAEWAADDRAVAGDPLRAVDLAEALVRVAGMGERASHSLLASTLLGVESDLTVRVERLLAGERATGGPGPRGLTLLAAFAAVGAAILLTAVLNPAVLQGIHGVLERLID